MSPTASRLALKNKQIAAIRGALARDRSKSKGGIAAALGVHASQVSQMLNPEKSRMVDVHEVQLVANYLGIEESALTDVDQPFHETIRSVPVGEEFDPDPDFVEDPERVDAARRFERRRLDHPHRKGQRVGGHHLRRCARAVLPLDARPAQRRGDAGTR